MITFEELQKIDVLPEEPVVKEGKVVYESDLRATAHSNGRASHLLGAEVGGPTEPPDESGDGDHNHDPKDQPLAMRLVIASAYLGFGALMVYAGVIVLKDAWKAQKEKNK